MQTNDTAHQMPILGFVGSAMSDGNRRMLLLGLLQT